MIDSKPGIRSTSGRTSVDVVDPSVRSRLFRSVRAFYRFVNRPRPEAKVRRKTYGRPLLVEDAPMWAGFVELIRVTIFAAAHLCAGSLGAGILGVSIVMRLAILPLTLRLARQARLQQARLAALQPEIEAIQRRCANDPARRMRQTQQLYAANGIRPSPSGILGLLVQLPLVGGVFAAVRAGLGTRVRFLWIGDLARPDALLVAAVTILTAGSMMLMPKTQGPSGASSTLVLLLLSVGGTLFFLWSASSAVALSMGAGSLVSGLQSWLLARDRVRYRERSR
jgi:YidC/Oxa1 family membrane protein insertase